MTADPFAPFLRAVLEMPDDDLPRLVAADWLDEHGDEARAEFIRAQVRLGTLPECRRCTSEGVVAVLQGGFCSLCRLTHTLRRRERELLQSPCGNSCWHSPIPHGGWGKWEYSRGFVASLTLTCIDLLKHAAAIFGAAPVESVVLAGQIPEQHTRHGESNYSWYSIGFGFPTDRATIPESLLDLLRGGRPGLSSSRVAYPTEAEALADLSAACIRFGRHAADLPAWEPAGRVKATKKETQRVE